MAGKQKLKWLVSLLCRILILPVAAFVKIMGIFIEGDQPFQLGSHTVSLIPGIIGNYFRKEYYRLTLQSCGSDVCIEFGTILHQAGVELGRRVYIGPRCSIGESIIEDDVMVGSNVDIISGKNQHNFETMDSPMREQGGRFQKIVIGADSWIGNSAVIMANVGKKSIVGAGSVVVNDVEPYSIVAGNPAKFLRRRQERMAG
jgi:virginiamycin A acetyltransferase